MYSLEDVVQPRDRRAWTEEEDELLRAAIEKEDPSANPPSKWHAIAKHIPNRTNKDCRKRWWAQMATRVSKGSWSTDEDERLYAAVEELGTKWAAVAGRVGTRNSGQCAKRWNDALNPAIDRSGWTPEEDQLLLKAVEVQGHSWANIARTYLPGRTGLAAKNRYNHLIRGNSDRSPSMRGRRMSGTLPMRRRNTRGSSISSISSTSSPRSIMTPPPPRSNASSPGSSAMPLTPPEILVFPNTADLCHKWDTYIPEEMTGLFHSGSTSRSSPSFSHPVSPKSENHMFNMFMQNSYGDYLEPSMDPTSYAALQPSSFLLDPCSPGTVLAESIDSWSASTNHYSYMDYPSHGLPIDPHLTTPSLASCGGNSSVNSTPQCTPQLSHSQYAHLGFIPAPEVSFGQFATIPDRTAIQLPQHTSDPNRNPINIAIRDNRGVVSSVQSHSHM